MKDLRYPIGLFTPADSYTLMERSSAIKIIAEFPQKLSQLLDNAGEDLWEKTYRPGGWAIYQLIHHFVDSHMTCFLRFKLVLTEESPTVKPYLENEWVKLEDSSSAEINASLKIIDGTHFKWSLLMNRMTEDDWNKEFFHPEKNRILSLNEAVMEYAWHCTHHLKHIELALESN